MWWVLLLLLLMRLVLVHVRTAQYSIDVTCLDYMRWLQRTRSPFDKINANRTRARAHTHNTHVCYNDEHLMKCRMPQLWRVYSMLYVYTTDAIPRQYHFEWAPMNSYIYMNEGMMTSPRIRYDSTVNIARRTTDLSGLNMLVIYTRMHRFYVQKHNNNKQKICFRFIVLWYILRTARTTLTQSNESMCVVYVCLVFCWTSVFCLFVRHLNRQWWSYLAYATRIPHAYVLYTIHFTNMQIIIICLHNLKFSKCHTFYAAIFHRIVIFIQYTSTSIE